MRIAYEPPCQSGLFRKATGTPYIFDETTGQINNVCIGSNAGYKYATFKRSGGVVYANIGDSMYGFSGFQTPVAYSPYSVNSAGTLKRYEAKQYSGNVYGVYWQGTSQWICTTTVP